MKKRLKNITRVTASLLIRPPDIKGLRWCAPILIDLPLNTWEPNLTRVYSSTPLLPLLMTATIIPCKHLKERVLTLSRNNLKTFGVTNSRAYLLIAEVSFRKGKLARGVGSRALIKPIKLAHPWRPTAPWSSRVKPSWRREDIDKTQEPSTICNQS